MSNRLRSPRAPEAHSAPAGKADKETCAIRLDHVSTRFGNHTVHREINLCVRRGEILGLVGGSGSGKTTLLREMIGLQAPSEGTVTINGEPLHGLDPGSRERLRQGCGVLFQGGALFSAMSVFDNIAMPLRELDLLDESMIVQLVCRKLSMVGLTPDTAHLMPAQLSGGMIKRVGLARAIALEPDLLFLDEPTSGLDPMASARFVQVIGELHQELGFTLVLVTHDVEVARDLCHRIAVLADQRIAALGGFDEVAASDHPVIRDFFHPPHARPRSGQMGGG